MRIPRVAGAKAAPESPEQPPCQLGTVTPAEPQLPRDPRPRTPEEEDSHTRRYTLRGARSAPAGKGLKPVCGSA